MPASGSGVWSRRRDEITIDRLQKFWDDLPPQARQELLKLDKQTLIEDARKKSYCSRCNGLLLECFAQIVMYGKSLQQDASEIDLSGTNIESRVTQAEQDRAQDPSIHPWGGLSTAKDDVLTLLDCFIKAKSLTVLQNVFDNALARERERKMRYPHACGAGGRGWISHGTREMCALHTAHPSCDTLADFWATLCEETRSSLLQTREEDFIEKLTRRFDRKRFCRDCRRNVTREFKELKELKRMRRQRRCTCWFCVDNGFRCEVFEDGIVVDWSQCLSESNESFHHFEWAVGTGEGESDISGFEDVGMNSRVHKNGIDHGQFENYFITLRAWRHDGCCTEYCVKAHVLKGQSRVHHRLLVGDGFVTITDGESVKSFFERAEKVEEEDANIAKDKDGNDLDGDGSHAQNHAKSPELAREFLMDSAAVIFKQQVEKAFREGTARQNAQSIFVSLALKLLEERVHVACKELITLEKQNKLLEEEENKMHEEQERRLKRRTKEREKKNRRKERLKKNGKDMGKRLFKSKSPDNISSTNLESTSTPNSRDSVRAEEDNAYAVDLCSPDRCIGQSSCRENISQNNVNNCNGVTELSPMDSSDCCTSEQSESSKPSPRLWKDFPQDQSCWYDDSQDEPGRTGDLQWQPIERKKRSARRWVSASSMNIGTRDRHQEDYRVIGGCFSPAARSGREMKMAWKSGVEKPRVQDCKCYPLDSLTARRGSYIGRTQKTATPKQLWERLDAGKGNSFHSTTDNISGSVGNVNPLKPVDCDASVCQKLRAECGTQHLASENSSNLLYKSETYQACENGERSQAASGDGTHMLNKQDCYSANEEGSWQFGDLMTIPCMSEGDRESSSSSTTSSSAQNPESSSSESEVSPDRISSSQLDAPSSTTASQSLLETCARKSFREYRPEATRRPHPFQDQLLMHHQSLHVPPHPSATMRLRHNHCWAAPTNGNFRYAQPSHLYCSPRVFGVPANQSIDYRFRYSNVNPYLASAFSHMLPEPIQKNTAASIRAMPPSPPCPNGAKQIEGHPDGDSMNLEIQPSKLEPLGQKDSSEGKNKRQDSGASFSLFQFNLPIASPVPTSSRDDEFSEREPLPQVQPQLCSREQTDLKEYNLFSTTDSGIFSFMQIIK